MALATSTPDRLPTPTQAELESLLSEWQRRLRLQDWTVRIKCVRVHEMSLAGTDGTCTWQLETKRAIVEIIDPIDYPPSRFGYDQDIEKTIVHELLHLHFAPFATPDGGPFDTAQEQAIDLIAGALVDARRDLSPTD
jgi:hypothetical protein